jgi:hypothetical protein
MRSSLLLLLPLAAGAAVFFAPSDANACGGCFPPPGEQQSVVTDHRMILALSQAKTTLYDQIQYTGSPSEFAWVLPIVGTVDVGLSSDALFTAFHNLSAVSVQEPPRRCPPPPPCDDADLLPEESSRGGSAQDAATAPPVNVLKEETVGPYATVQLESTDPDALTSWLETNGYNIPADIRPVIGQYVTEHFNFLALKLRPGQGIQSMRPVRVTTPGAGIALPLRMIAAGAGATVGVTLWITAEGRYEPQNFPSYVIKNEDLVWDWASGSSNYKEVRAQRSSVEPGKTWELESTDDVQRWQIENVVNFSGGYEDEKANGVVVKTRAQLQKEDLDIALNAPPQGTPYDQTRRLTRLRVDLSRAALATDLVMTASADQSVLDNVRIPKGEVGQPQCPIYDGCYQIGTAPRDQAGALSHGGGGTFACDQAASRGLRADVLFGLFAFAGVAFVRKRRNMKSL